MSPATTGRCPNCGAPLTFALGSSRSAVCAHCNALVARAGQDFTTVGKVAELIPTASSLGLGMTGTHQGVSFTLVGRVQYQWTAGVWDEWYVSFADGRWGWLAEAQGRYYVTTRVATRRVPGRDELRPGTSVSLDGGAPFVVSDLKTAEVVGLEGELPDLLPLGSKPFTADLERTGGDFATLSYEDDAPPETFLGKEVPLASLGMKGEAPLARPGRSADKLECPNCRAAIALRTPQQTVHLACEFCGALLDATSPKLQLLAVLERQRSTPPIPLGTTGTLRARTFQVVGWMRRSCVVDGTTYDWEELLLFEPKRSSFSWLVRSTGHWQLGDPVPGADVTQLGGSVRYGGKRYRHFSSVTGRVEEVLGEFYWAVRVGDTARLRDLIAPPEGISVEETADELVYTRMTHVTVDEVADGFQVPALREERAWGVGAIQPWPREASYQLVRKWMFGGLVALFLVFVGLELRPSHVLFEQTFGPGDLTVDVEDGGTGGFEPPSRVHGFVSEPFYVPGRQALEVRLQANVSNSWGFMGGGLIDEASGEARTFELESSYYSGADSDGSWSEGSQVSTAVLPSLSAGQYVLRGDLQWNPAAPIPPVMQVEVRTNTVSPWQFLAALLALFVPFLALVTQRAAFENQRNENANPEGTA